MIIKKLRQLGLKDSQIVLYFYLKERFSCELALTYESITKDIDNIHPTNTLRNLNKLSELNIIVIGYLGRSHKAYIFQNYNDMHGYMQLKNLKHINIKQNKKFVRYTIDEVSKLCSK